MKLTFLGAAGTVTGSKYLIEEEGRRILVDCGLFQGLKQLRLLNRDPFPVSPASIDAVVLTHAHLDHTGYLPLLVKQGFRGPVICTEPTFDLCTVLLPDSGHLQEEEAETANRYGYSKHSPALPLYTREDAVKCLDSFETVTFGQDIELAEGLTARFSRAGHMLGAASILLRSRNSSILFSGDIGRPEDDLLPAPEVPEEADYLVVESTYGDRLHAPEDPTGILSEVVKRTAARGGAVIIPAFAVGRAQSLLLHLWNARRENGIPDIPIFVDSPMADQATDVYERHATETRLPADLLAAVCNSGTFTRSVDDSKKIDRMAIPRIIISASGMATGGRVVHHLKMLADDPRNTILFSGYQAAGTRGATILGGAKAVKIHGQYVPIRAEVVSLENISAHADYSEILGWMGRFSSPPRKTFVTHGEPVAADALRLHIKETLGWDAVVPAMGESVTLD
ncbi:MAG: MBL fold metallo-hydrolase [Gemmatimonadota bacterium]|jgi:metallo-beta-lactamase family protein|nr:MBL fold metallo-hydrolase [Gemmatimonadota bacterium]